MRKTLFITILLLVAFLCALWSPWRYWNFSFIQLLGIFPPEEVGGLQVSSLAGELQVFIDGQSQGTVDPDTSPLVIPAVEPGERQIRLERDSEVVDAYWQFNKLIKFQSGVDVIISYELGPSEEFSEGHIIYATKSSEVSEILYLNVDADTNDAKVFLDGIEVGTTPIVGFQLDVNKQHVLTIEKLNYDTQEFTLLPAEQSGRDKLKGFQLNVDVNLFLQPIRVN